MSTATTTTQAFFYLMHNGEEFFTSDYAGKTIRQLFENGVSRGVIGSFDFNSVTLSVNNQQIAGLDSYADDVIARLQEVGNAAPGTPLAVYAVAVEQAGTKAAATTVEEARSHLESLEEAGWELTDSNPMAGTYTFTNAEDEEHVVMVSMDEMRQHEAIGSPRLLAASKLHSRLNLGSGAAAAASPATAGRSAGLVIQQFTRTIADALGVPASKVSITISG